MISYTTTTRSPEEENSSLRRENKYLQSRIKKTEIKEMVFMLLLPIAGMSGILLERYTGTGAIMFGVFAVLTYNLIKEIKERK